MWIGVTRRFERFHAELLLTADQFTDGTEKQLRVRQSLQRAYNDITTDSPPGFMVGSWGKRTQINPPNDIDIFVPISLEIFQRFEQYAGNRKSALLREIRMHLRTTYPQTDMRADGQVVVVAFNSVTIEVVPVYLFNDAGQYLMPDTNDGGSWKAADPFAEAAEIERVDILANGNVRSVIRMLKMWKRHCNVPLKSYLLEALVCEFFETYAYRNYDFFFYDWFIRDFLKHLITRRSGSITKPGTYEIVNLGEEWVSRAVTAKDYALRACEYEHEDYVINAGQEWQKIFGPRIQSYLI